MKWPTWIPFFHLSRSSSAKTRHDAAHRPVFSELSLDDIARLDQQRAIIADVAKQRYGIARLEGKEVDLPVLQRLLDDAVFDKSQTYELQCLGVAFGDVLASKFALRWVTVTDEFGSDPTLRFGDTSMNVNALTIISKRAERDEDVDLFNLLRQTHLALAQLHSELS